MLDVYEIKEGKFEIVDSQMQELRAKRMLYYRLVKFVMLLLSIFASTFVIISYINENIFWTLPAIIPIGLFIFAYRHLELLKKQLEPQISSVLLEYDREKRLTDIRIRKWQQLQIDQFIEEEIRYNQAIGFRVMWHDNGFLEIELIVDENYPGTKIMETFDFYLVSEFAKFSKKALPNHQVWQLILEDGSKWDKASIEEFENNIESARIPWIIREFFKEL